MNMFLVYIRPIVLCILYFAVKNTLKVIGQEALLAVLSNISKRYYKGLVIL